MSSERPGSGCPAVHRLALERYLRRARDEFPEDHVPKGWTVDAHCLRNPWVQLVAGVICMAMIANLQYGWTVFVDPIAQGQGWGRAAIQVSFAIFVLVETWLVPFEAALVDKYGPRIMVAAGGVLAGLAWVIDANAHIAAHALHRRRGRRRRRRHRVRHLHRQRAQVVRRPPRPRRRADLGRASAPAPPITVIPLTIMIKNSGYQHTFLFFGILQGYRRSSAFRCCSITPPKAARRRPARSTRSVLQGNRDYMPHQTLRLAGVLGHVRHVRAGRVGRPDGRRAARVRSPGDRYINTIPVTIFAITAPALTYALSLNNIMNGITRPLLGFISDRIGREYTMFGAFLLEGIGIFALMQYGTTPVAFVLLSGLVFFAWGEIYSIFPATTRDHFGQKYATTNYGMLYTAKGTASLLVPFASVITAATGNWTAVLAIAAIFNIIAALMALFVLRPMRLREIAQRRRSPSHRPRRLPT